MYFLDDVHGIDSRRKIVKIERRSKSGTFENFHVIR